MTRRVLLLRIARRYPYGRTFYWLFSSAGLAWGAAGDPFFYPDGRVNAIPRISSAHDVIVRRQVTCWPLGGSASYDAGQIMLLNGDRRLDYLLRGAMDADDPNTSNLTLRNLRYELRWCSAAEADDPEYIWDDCRVWQAGFIESVAATDDYNIIIAFADPLRRLDAPVQREVYPDDWPNPAARGQPKPICLGDARYVPGVLRRSTDLILDPGPPAVPRWDAYVYDFHLGSWAGSPHRIAGIDAAFDRGDALVADVDWTMTPDATGIRLANKPDRPVCAHVRGFSGLTASVTGVLVGGAFTVIDGSSTRQYLARLRTSGTGGLDITFAATANGAVAALALQSDGRIVVGGTFTSIGGVTRNRIARLSASGGTHALDAGFNPDADAEVRTIAIQPDGKIIVAGAFTTIGGVTRNRVARLNADGSLDTGFNPNANSAASAIAIQPDGKVIIAGTFTIIAGVTRNRVARLNADGSLDTGFNPNASGTVNAIAIQPDGKVIVAGAFTTIGGVTRNRVARLNADGSLDTGFNPNANSAASAIAIQPDGKVIIAGTFTIIAGVTRNRVARLNADGSLDTGFGGPGANNSVNALALVSSYPGGNSAHGIIRWVFQSAGLDPETDIDNTQVAEWFNGPAAPPARLHGFYADRPITASAILRQIMDGYCGWIMAARDGRYIVGRLEDMQIVGAPYVIPASRIRRVRHWQEPAPNLSTRLAGRRNHTVHADGDIAGSVDAELRAELQAEYTIAEAAAAPDAGAYGHALAAVAQPTLLQDEARMKAEISAVCGMFAQPADRYEIDCVTDAEAPDVGTWVTVIHASFGLDGGRKLQVLGVTERWQSRIVTLDLIGVTPL